jgi:G3E family GTPase
VLSQMVEHADVVVGAHGLDPVSRDLLAALTRPEVAVLDGADQLDGRLLAEGLHDHTRTSTWTDPLRLGDLPPLGSSRVWRLDLRSEAPFEPERLLHQVGRLGSGRHRSRGRFWLPTRPDRVLEWAGAGGQLSIGTLDPWGNRPPRTRLLFTGTGTPPADLIEAFGDLLARDAAPSGQRPDEDGFEPWLGPIGEVA